MRKPQTPQQIKEHQIREWFNTKANPNNPAHRQAILRAARMIYSKQTTKEQHNLHTNELNNVGFNQHDAGFGSRLALWAKPDLPVHTAKAAISMLKKYARQLASLTCQNTNYLTPSYPST